MLLTKLAWMEDGSTSKYVAREAESLEANSDFGERTAEKKLVIMAKDKMNKCFSHSVSFASKAHNTRTSQIIDHPRVKFAHFTWTKIAVSAKRKLGMANVHDRPNRTYL